MILQNNDNQFNHTENYYHQVINTKITPSKPPKNLTELPHDFCMHLMMETQTELPRIGQSSTFVS